jgi:hypothetical protein
MSFRAYMSKVRTDGLPLGYFAQHEQEDLGFPDSQTMEELEAYLVERKSDPVTIVSAHQYWKDYQASRNQI